MGKVLARSLGRPFADVDDFVVKDAGMTIDTIFEQFGEADFRARESLALARAAHIDGAIVALGGGTLLAEGNRSLIATRGRLVYLRASVALLERRIEAQNVRRPLLVGTSVGHLLDTRRALYEAADMVVDIDGKPVRAIVAEIAGRV